MSTKTTKMSSESWRIPPLRLATKYKKNKKTCSTRIKSNRMFSKKKVPTRQILTAISISRHSKLVKCRYSISRPPRENNKLRSRSQESEKGEEDKSKNSTLVKKITNSKKLKQKLRRKNKMYLLIS